MSFLPPYVHLKKKHRQHDLKLRLSFEVRVQASLEDLKTVNIKYEWLIGMGGMGVSDAVLADCSKLYSTHYGIWGPKHKKSGSKIQLSPNKLKEWLSSPDAKIVRALHNNRTVGYAIAIQTKTKDFGMVSWVTQLVVHQQYRRSNIAKTLLFSVWGFTNHWAWGLVSANPYAIRALEKATRRRCDPGRIVQNARKLLNIGEAHVPYIQKNVNSIITNNESRIFTNFFVSHEELPQMIEQVKKAASWNMGELEEGWEWLAFTFNDQSVLALSEKEIEQMLEASDQVAKDAYSKMDLDPNMQRWMKHAKSETQFVVDNCKLGRKSKVLDVGCGVGRHSLQLAKICNTVCGVDYVRSMTDKAVKSAQMEGIKNATFICADFQTKELSQKYDAVLCLYDVIGSFVNDDQNLKVLKNIGKHLNKEGFLLLSVMNRQLTENRARYRFILKDDPNPILNLAPSATMERTGEIFNPDFYLIDSSTGVVYRKEQFTLNGLPAELLVRDRRYFASEIENLCKKAGFKIEWTRHVHAGAWDQDLGADDGKAKEILMLCRPR